MAIRIAVPTKKYFKPLIDNFDKIKDQYDLELLIAPEDKVAEMLMEGEAEIGLLNPLDYGKLLLSNEFEIIPTTCLSAASYSDLEKIYFAENLTSISSIGLETKDPFLELITKITLLEKYNFETNSSIFEGSAEKALKKFDAVLSSEIIPGKPNSLDLTEEWFDTFEYELPLGFWVTRMDADTKTFAEVTLKIAKEELPDTLPMVEEVKKADTNYEREGIIKLQFDRSTESAIDDILELFYQLGYLDEMIDAKISQN
jgi:predicted solute-binding protein